MITRQEKHQFTLIEHNHSQAQNLKDRPELVSELNDQSAVQAFASVQLLLLLGPPPLSLSIQCLLPAVLPVCSKQIELKYNNT